MELTMDDLPKILLRPAEVIAAGYAPSKTTLRRMVQGGFPKPIQLTKGRVAYRKADLDAWLASRPEGVNPVPCKEAAASA
jgi:predicted DNA-binding transcriptional regulator AlpA